MAFNGSLQPRPFRDSVISGHGFCSQQTPFTVTLCSCSYWISSCVEPHWQKSIKMLLFVSNNLLLAWLISPSVDYVGIKKKEYHKCKLFLNWIWFQDCNWKLLCHIPPALSFFKNPNPLSLQILTVFFCEISGLTSISFNLQDHYVIPQIIDVQKRLELQFVECVQGEGKQSSMSYLITRLTNTGTWCNSTASAHQRLLVFSLR